LTLVAEHLGEFVIWSFTHSSNFYNSQKHSKIWSTKKTWNKGNHEIKENPGNFLNIRLNLAFAKLIYQKRNGIVMIRIWW
jgi:hypothetical protein